MLTSLQIVVMDVILLASVIYQTFDDMWCIDISKCESLQMEDDGVLAECLTFLCSVCMKQILRNIGE